MTGSAPTGLQAASPVQPSGIAAIPIPDGGGFFEFPAGQVALLGIPGTIRERKIPRRRCLLPRSLSWGLSSCKYGPHTDVSVVAIFAALPAKTHSMNVAVQ